MQIMVKPAIPIRRAALDPEDIQFGKPLPYDIEDTYGYLLLSRGSNLDNEEQRQRLLQVGRKPFHITARQGGSGGVSKRRSDPTTATLNPFDELYRIMMSLQETFRWLERDKFMRRFNLLVSRIGNLIELDADASIGAAHLDEEFPYSVRHPIRKALLSDTVAATMQFPDDERRSIVSAALGANIGMLDCQDELDRQKATLSEEQWQVVRAHPRRSVQRLLANGMEDRLCLRIVSEHHERLDGSGYPEGLREPEICRGARLLMIADTYMAMVANRSYRRATSVRDTLLELLDQSGAKYDRQILSGFINTIGIYPAGSFVALDNGEQGVVIHRGQHSISPVVAVVLKPNGQPTARPLMRDTSLADTPAIVSLMPTSEVVKRYQLGALWGYDVRHNFS